ncbi:MAG: hypothetical protein ACRD09_07975 [Vicinamibacterales bacterium]
MSLDAPLSRLLILIGAGFLVANLWLLAQFVRYQRRRSSAVLTWPTGRPPNAWVFVVLGAALGLVIIVKLVILRAAVFQRLGLLYVFGESMMLVYFGYVAPMSWRIGRGFYEDGIWADTGFVRYTDIGGLSWREEEQITLVLISRARQLARRLTVPQAFYGAARRLLRDRIAAHEIHFAGEKLDLGGHDERENV